MNISITNDCNRRCAYCFQKDWYLTPKMGKDVTEMPVKTVDDILAWYLRSESERHFGIKLLGGEPLLHSEFPTILDCFKFYNIDVCLISNISIDSETFAFLNENYFTRNSAVKGFLVNSDYPASQRETFLTNYEMLCSSLQEFSVSTTLLPNTKEIMKSADRMLELIDIYKKYRGNTTSFRIRLAPLCPNQTEPGKFKFYDFSKDFAEFFNVCWSHGQTQAGFDCPLNFCEISQSAVKAFREMGVMINFRQCSPDCGGGPFDILVDDSIIWCSSTPNIKLDSWRDYPNYKEAQIALGMKWKEYWLGTKLKCDYNNCGKFNPALCQGVCAAKNIFIENQEEKVIKFVK